LGVSRNPIREAIGRLEQQGLVVTVANRGAFIVQPTPEQAYDMFVLRANLEHLALRLAFARWNTKTFAPVADVMARMNQLVRTSRRPNAEAWDEFNLLDTEFHTRLVEASGNSAVLRAWETVAPIDFIFLYDRTRTVDFTASEFKGMAERHASLLKPL